MTKVLTQEDPGDYEVELTQQQDNWQNEENKTGLENAGMTLSGNPSKDGTATLTYDEDTEKVTVTFD